MPDLDQELTQLGDHWRRYLRGDAALEHTGAGLRLAIAGTTTHGYTNAQIDDYQGRPRRHFLWRPPLRLTVRARFSHLADDPEHRSGLRGTAGFGFWNDPFLMTGARFPALPRAIWFFYASPPSNIKLDIDTPGCGWKVATIDAGRPAALLLAPLAPLAVPLMNARALYRHLWPPIQRALGVREALVPVEMTAWHTYVLEWGQEQAHFYVDGAPLLREAPSPQGPLGLVLWIDNQYMVVTPWGQVRWGRLAVAGRQWMEVARVRVEAPISAAGTSPGER